MSKEIVFEITVDGHSIHMCNSLSLHQSFNQHHMFELVVDQDALDELGSHSMEESQDFIGKNITICFGQHTTGDNTFKGLITEVALMHGQGSWGTLMLKGYSPTYLMESGANYVSYERATLKDLLAETLKHTAPNDMGIDNKPHNTDTFGYMCQYAESNFAFINRLSAQYGEWFFYDGSTLHFGRPSKLKNTELIYGQHIASMNFAMRLVPSTIQHYSYQYQNDHKLETQLPNQAAGSNSYTAKALEASDKLYSTPVKQPAEIQVSDMGGLDQHAKTHKARLASSAVVLTGEGDSPNLILGNLITIQTAKKDGLGYDVQGEYIVTKLTHTLTGTGKYTNSFEAIPSANEVMPYKAATPIAQTQMAIVTDNDDPKDLGRVRVQMLWQQDTPQKTDWIRVMAPDAGGSTQVGKNRGLVFIPEVGDQVLIGFRYNDPNRPFVLGSLFHGNTAQGGGKQNETKSMTTKAGSTLIFNDNDHSVKLQTSNGNSVQVDEKSGAITISSGSSISINSKSININGSESISIIAPSITIGTLAGKHPTNTVTIEGKAVTVEGENTLSNTSKSVTMNGTEELNNYGGKYLMQVSEATVDGGGRLVMSSGQTDIA